MVSPAARRQAAGYLQADFGVSERRACSVVELPRATCRYRSERVEDPQLRKDLCQLAAERPRRIDAAKHMTVAARTGSARRARASSMLRHSMRSHSGIRFS